MGSSDKRLSVAFFLFLFTIFGGHPVEDILEPLLLVSALGLTGFLLHILPAHGCVTTPLERQRSNDDESL